MRTTVFVLGWLWLLLWGFLAVGLLILEVIEGFNPKSIIPLAIHVVFIVPGIAAIRWGSRGE